MTGPFPGAVDLDLDGSVSIRGDTLKTEILGNEGKGRPETRIVE